MKAVVMRSGRLVLDEIPSPLPGPGEVLVQTLSCGICGSDLHALRHFERMAEASRRGNVIASIVDPRGDVVMGHEFCAEVVDHGPGATKVVPVGSRVCAMPVVFRPSGLHTVGYSNELPGGYGEQMVLSEMLLLPVPDHLPTEEATLTEPMAVGMHAVARAGLVGGESAIVLGCGPIGLAVIAALKLAGVGPVIAADFSPLRRALAERMGADEVVDPAKASPYASWWEVAAPAGYDPASLEALLGVGEQPPPCVIFECVGVPGMIEKLLEGAPRRSTVVVVGVCMERDSFEPIVPLNKEIDIRFVFGYLPEEFAATLGRIADRRLDVRPLVTARVGIDGIAGAFEELARPDVQVKMIAQY
jgi:threonine dehydrogenase-like Zn-dependent dehydrogenase